jgi:hypothetical protein
VVRSTRYLSYVFLLIKTLDDFDFSWSELPNNLIAQTKLSLIALTTSENPVFVCKKHWVLSTTWNLHYFLVLDLYLNWVTVFLLPYSYCTIVGFTPPKNSIIAVYCKWMRQASSYMSNFLKTLNQLRWCHERLLYLRSS